MLLSLLPLQVPYHMASACSRAARELPESDAECAAVSALCIFSKCLTPLQALTGSSNTARQYREQLRRSGLLEALPGMMAAAADQLLANIQQDLPPLHSLNSSSTSSGEEQASSYCRYTHLHADNLLSVFLFV